MRVPIWLVVSVGKAIGIFVAIILGLSAGLALLFGIGDSLTLVLYPNAMSYIGGYLVNWWRVLFEFAWFVFVVWIFCAVSSLID